MTKEELEKEAREYLAEHSKYSEVFGEFFVAVDTLTAMLDFAEPREKRIAELEKENAELKAENELLKSMLYCTKRSCNNCGKVNCENFQRQRKDCCENWVSYKDYIKELEAQIEKMKCCGNCAKNGHICVAEEMQGNLCGKNKDKWELRR